jgi:DNA polymerase elongation subunit (family B)
MILLTASAGYNINNFDLPYLFDRAKALRVDGDAHQWGRIRHRCGSTQKERQVRTCGLVLDVGSKWSATKA